MLFLALACTSAPPPSDEPGTDASHSTGSDTDDEPSDTSSPTATGSTADTAPPLPEYDCAAIPVEPLSEREVPAARGYHDVVFDPGGHITGNSVSEDLLRVDYDGNVEVFVPNAGPIEQMAWLPDGDLAVASGIRGILRVAPNGGATVINPDIRPYGLILGPDQMLYSANQDQVHRVDPTTGAAEVLVPRNALPRGTPRVLNFDLSYTKLYVGTYGGSRGRIYAFDLDETYTPVGPPVELATGVGSGGYHDSLGVDICGYLYVADYDTSALYRVSPSGQVQKLRDSSGLLRRDYGHGLEWGNGVGGWLEDAIYLPRPYDGNKVTELVLGVPSRDWPGIGIHLP